jgi:hypothetical protein
METSTELQNFRRRKKISAWFRMTRLGIFLLAEVRENLMKGVQGYADG